MGAVKRRFDGAQEPMKPRQIILLVRLCDGELDLMIARDNGGISQPHGSDRRVFVER